MYAHSSNVNLYFRELPSAANCVDGVVSCDRSLTYEFPLSPSNQLMYESEPLQDQCCISSFAQTDRTASAETGGVISPTVEGLTFEDYEALSCVFTTEPLPLVASSPDEASDQTSVKYLSDPLKMIDTGPTLTQLNSDDLEATLLDDFSMTGNSFCVDMSSLDCSQLLAIATAASKPASETKPPLSTAATVSVSAQQPQQQVEDAASERQRVHPQPLVSQLLNSKQQIASVMRERSHPCQDQMHITTSSAPLLLPVLRNGTVAAAQSNLDSNWEAIESFLKSEDERMAAEVHKQQVQQFVSGVQNIKSDTQGSELKECLSRPTFLPVSEKSEPSRTDVADASDSESSVDDNSMFELSDFLTDVTSGARKDKTYFWQYNTQSKGPKGKRLCHVVEEDNPYVLHDFEDPVFDSELLAASSPCYRHSGKARRGDGNDVTPNPGKLYATGKELKKLVYLINTMCPAGELPSAVRARTLREKNKYASRICRLKKKAQHEANKIKLYGLEQEHRQLTKVLTMIKREICQRVKEPRTSDREKLTSKLSKLIKNHLTVMTAGHTIDYVNSVLAKVAAGDSSGGLTITD